MKLRKLDKRVLKLWYIRASIASLSILGFFTGIIAILNASEVSSDVMIVSLLLLGLPIFLLLAIILILPYWRYKMYEWGYDDKRIIVKKGVIFRRKVVIPVCQIQDLHRTQGPLMMMLKLGDVTISTAGSNFDISTLTTDEADLMINELERNLEKRIEELKNETI